VSDREFENYLTLLASLLRLSGSQREAVASELRDHLEERVSHLTARGIAREEAVGRAISEFGDAARLAGELSKIAELKRRRWIMRVTTGSLAVTAALVLAVFTLWPDARHGVAPEQAVAQEGAAEVEVVEEGKVPGVVEQIVSDQACGRSVGLSRRDRETQRKLETTTNAFYEDEPLRNVVRALGKDAGIQVLIDKAALDSVGYSGETTVSVDLQDLPLSNVLRIMLRDLQLTYIIKDGVVVITTPDVAEQELSTRIYDVSDIMGVQAGSSEMDAAAVAAAIGKRTNNLISILTSKKESQSTEVVLRQAVLQAAEMQNMIDNLKKWSSARDSAMDSLFDVLTGTIEPETWEEIGGPGSIRWYRTYLIIHQTDRVHHQVEALLEGMCTAMGDRLGKARPELSAEDFGIEKTPGTTGGRGGGGGGGFY